MPFSVRMIRSNEFELKRLWKIEERIKQFIIFHQHEKTVFNAFRCYFINEILILIEDTVTFSAHT